MLGENLTDPERDGLVDVDAGPDEPELGAPAACRDSRHGRADADPVSRLEELEKLLSALPGEPMLASTLDGFVAGLLVCPALVLPGEWLQEAWNAYAATASESVFETEQQAKDVTRLIMAHYNAVSRALQAGRGRYEVVYDVDRRQDDTMWEIWIEGFARAMALRPASWDSIAAADRGTRAALAGMRALIEIADATSSRAKTEVDELTKMAPDKSPPGSMTSTPGGSRSPMPPRLDQAC